MGKEIFYGGIVPIGWSLIILVKSFTKYCTSVFPEIIPNTHDILNDQHCTRGCAKVCQVKCYCYRATLPAADSGLHTYCCTIRIICATRFVFTAVYNSRNLQLSTPACQLQLGSQAVQLMSVSLMLAAPSLSLFPTMKRRRSAT